MEKKFWKNAVDRIYLNHAVAVLKPHGFLVFFVFVFVFVFFFHFSNPFETSRIQRNTELGLVNVSVHKKFNLSLQGNNIKNREIKIVLKLEIKLLKTAIQLLLGNLNNFLYCKRKLYKRLNWKLNLAVKEKKKVKKSIPKYFIPAGHSLLETGKMVQDSAAVNTNIVYCNSKNPYSKVSRHL